MDLITAYHQAIQCEGIVDDPAQAAAVEQLDIIQRKLLNNNKHGLVQTLRSKLWGHQLNADRLQGCYLWGDVGRGKTWLMDLFYQSLPFRDKSRIHFHEFMQKIHLRLKAINGKRDPLVNVAEDIALRNRVICLDEFHVSDISDAMLLYGLLDALYKKNVILLMTSNVHPDDLYKNGLQRSRFLPAIELIKQRNQLLHVDGDRDHRLSSVNDNSNYLMPGSLQADLQLENKFNQLATGVIVQSGSTLINKRNIKYKMMADNIVWYEFDEICNGPRAASDYLYLARNYDYVIISNIPEMNDSNDDSAKRFINLIDALYDRHVKIIISAAHLPAELYSGHRFIKEFKRTVSRLEEVRSTELILVDKNSLQERNTLLSN